MEITAQVVKELRDRTGAGIMECKKALNESGGDLARAEVILREKGEKGPKDPTREVRQGLVESYIHPGGQRGALIELNCETDFVARTDEFRTLAREIAMHIAATEPRYLERESIPESDLEACRADFEREIRLGSSFDEDTLPRRLNDRLEGYIKEVALLEQPYVRDANTSVRQLILSVASRTGENIRVGRFAHFKVGG